VYISAADCSPFKLECPELNVSDNLFESDSGRRTCAGGTAAVYMILDLVKEKHGDRFVELVAESLNIGEIRGSNHKHREMPFIAASTTNSQLRECIELMEANIEKPLQHSELAGLIGISCRQLERIFNYYLKYSPRSYYIEIRLLDGQKLIRQLGQKIIEIALLYGFSNGGHFSTAYKRLFGHSPQCDRTNSNMLHSTNGSQLGARAA
jgi:transcriptional regulator GlxA family with amidase domain